MVATGNYDEAVIGHINDNMNDATRQIAAFQSQVQVQQDALLVVDRQMSYMRQGNLLKVTMIPPSIRS